MAQGVLPFKYEEEKRDTGMTGLARLPVYLDLASVMGINDSIEKHLHTVVDYGAWGNFTGPTSQLLNHMLVI